MPAVAPPDAHTGVAPAAPTLMARPQAALLPIARSTGACRVTAPATAERCTGTRGELHASCTQMSASMILGGFAAGPLIRVPRVMKRLFRRIW